MFPTEVAARYVWHSNALDGILLSEEQTRSLLEGRSAEEVGQNGKRYDAEVATSHNLALNYVQQLATSQEPVTERHFREVHRFLTKGLLLSAGEYRECALRIRGLLIPSPADTILRRMEALADLVNNGCARATKKDQLAWRVHHEFITIHPFIEANGRMARLLLNLVRLRLGMELAIVRRDDRESYGRAIVEFQQQKIARAKKKTAAGG